MKNEDLNIENKKATVQKKSFWEGRTVMTCVITVTAFLCI